MPQYRPNHVFHRLTGSLSQLAPQHPCLLCDTKSPERICPNCQDYLASPKHCCQVCGLPLRHHSLMCGECLKQPPYFDDSYSPFLYQRPLDKLINDFKHNHNLVTGKGISVLFNKAITTHYREHHLTLPRWILPVPLHWRRQWQRGFNQAAFLCSELHQQLGIEVLKQVKKTTYTVSQGGLSRKQRLSNLRNSFHVKQTLEGEPIAIVDDVMTTGTTANSLAKALKKAGAGRVSVWTVARTPRHNE